MLRVPVATLAALIASSALALPGDPTGEWLVEGGFATTRIEKCGDKFWGVISWQKTAGGKDVNNPDPAKRDRPTLGMPILLGMGKAAGESNRWDGQIYNSENGKLYTANISLKSEDVLKVEGCVLGILCGGQDWKRVKDPAPATTAATTPSRPGATAPRPTTASAKPAGAAAEGERITLSTAELCTSVGAGDKKPAQPAPARR